MKTYDSIEQRIQIIENEVAILNEEIEILKTPAKNDREKILFKFIETGSTGKTKDYVRELGIKSERGSLFSSGDVSRLLKEGAPDVREKLLSIAREVAKGHNKNGPMR